MEHTEGACGQRAISREGVGTGAHSSHADSTLGQGEEVNFLQTWKEREATETLEGAESAVDPDRRCLPASLPSLLPPQTPISTCWPPASHGQMAREPGSGGSPATQDTDSRSSSAAEEVVKGPSTGPRRRQGLPDHGVQR